MKKNQVFRPMFISLMLLIMAGFCSIPNNLEFTAPIKRNSTSVAIPSNGISKSISNSTQSLESKITSFLFYKTAISSNDYWNHVITFSEDVFDISLNTNAKKLIYKRPISSGITSYPFSVDYSNYQYECDVDHFNYFEDLNQTTAYSKVKPGRTPPPAVNFLVKKELNAKADKKSKMGTKSQEKANKSLSKKTTDQEDQKNETLATRDHLKSAKFSIVGTHLQVDLIFVGMKCDGDILYLPYLLDYPNYMTIHTTTVGTNPNEEYPISFSIPGMAEGNRLAQSYVLLVKPHTRTFESYPQYNEVCGPNSLYSLLSFHF